MLPTRKNLKSNGDNKKEASVLVYAAALQDHYIRNSQIRPLNTTNIGPLNRPIKSIRIKATSQLKPIGLIGQNNNKGDYGGKMQSLSQEKMQKDKPILAIIENNIKQQEKNEKVLNDMKLEQYNKKLTLAQRLGLIEKPPKPLTNDEWAKIEEIGKKRLGEEETCPICLEPFKIPNNQVILSCSHVFHKTCLTNFEKHTKMHVCPICRRRDYEKRNYDAGFLLFIGKAIIKVQKVWRGYIARKKFYEYLITYYKPTSTLFRRRLIAFKLRNLSNKMEEKMKKKRQISDQIINELDVNAAKNINLINQLSMLDAMRRENHNNLNDIMPHVTNLLSSEPMKLAREKLENHANINWDKAAKSAFNRKEGECPICFGKFDSTRKVYVLDCTHMFHCHCLNAFEYYDVYNEHNCPVCRHKYAKKEMDFVES